MEIAHKIALMDPMQIISLNTVSTNIDVSFKSQ